jgi:hypothetical protein
MPKPTFVTAPLRKLRAKHAGLKPGSDRNFGYFGAAFLFIVSMLPVIRGLPAYKWAFVAATGFAFAAVAFPRVLRPVNVTWFYIGLVLNAIMTPVIMALIFMIAVVPIGLLMRLLRKDVLNLRQSPGAESYWTRKTDQAPSSMRDQF